MKTTINCFLPYADSAQAAETIKNLQANESIAKIYLLNIGNEAKGECPAGCEMLEVKSLEASSTMRVIAAHADSDFVMVYTKYTTLRPGLFALERMMRLAADSGAGMVYADRYNVTADGHRSNAPVIDYQQGSLRDDFDFGSVLMFTTEAFVKAANMMKADYDAAGLYDLRLKLSQIAPIVHINEYLYSDAQPQ